MILYYTICSPDRFVQILRSINRKLCKISIYLGLSTGYIVYDPYLTLVELAPQEQTKQETQFGQKSCSENKGICNAILFDA